VEDAGTIRKDIHTLQALIQLDSVDVQPIEPTQFEVELSEIYDVKLLAILAENNRL
jgi:hypothetical protein